MKVGAFEGIPGVNPLESAGLTPSVAAQLRPDSLRRFAEKLLKSQLSAWHPDTGGDEDTAAQLLEALEDIGENALLEVIRDHYVKASASFSAAFVAGRGRLERLNEEQQTVATAVARYLMAPQPGDLSISALRGRDLTVLNVSGYLFSRGEVMSKMQRAEEAKATAGMLALSDQTVDPEILRTARIEALVDCPAAHAKIGAELQRMNPTLAELWSKVTDRALTGSAVLGAAYEVATAMVAAGLDTELLRAVDAKARGIAVSREYDRLRRAGGVGFSQPLVGRSEVAVDRTLSQLQSSRAVRFEKRRAPVIEANTYALRVAPDGTVRISTVSHPLHIVGVIESLNEITSLTPYHSFATDPSASAADEIRRTVGLIETPLPPEIAARLLPEIRSSLPRSLIGDGGKPSGHILIGAGDVRDPLNSMTIIGDICAVHPQTETRCL